MSRGLAMIGFQQSAQTLNADDLTLMTFMLGFDDLVEALVNPFMVIVLVGLLPPRKVAFLRLTAVSGRVNSAEMEVRSDISAT